MGKVLEKTVAAIEKNGPTCCNGLIYSEWKTMDESGEEYCCSSQNATTKGRRDLAGKVAWIT